MGKISGSCPRKVYFSDKKSDKHLSIVLGQNALFRNRSSQIQQFFQLSLHSIGQIMFRLFLIKELSWRLMEIYFEGYFGRTFRRMREKLSRQDQKSYTASV
ncbi:MAG: hypothetical protein A2Z83_05850 [Omnitrophica bacterium GWA2_52_8]|nr:MAG: hypothetical protein A2Z83_05850 [Omnitrophica bacterium GWA2_52_8]